MDKMNSTLQPTPSPNGPVMESRASLLLTYRDAPSFRIISLGIVVLFSILLIFVWNWRQHKLTKDKKLGYVQARIPFFTDTILLLWGLGSGYGIIFAMKSPFYEIGQISTSVGIIFKGVGAILIGFIIGAVHVYYESENDYRTIRKSLSDMKLIKWDFNEERVNVIKCNFKDMFLVFWSLGSGYGIIFAIESFVYELFGIKTVMAFWIKPYVAILIGFIIGCVHFYFDVVQSRINEYSKYAKADRVPIPVNEHQTTDDDTDLDIDTDMDENVNESENENTITGMTDYETNISYLNEYYDEEKLERTVTVEECDELITNDMMKSKMTRSKTSAENKAEKRRSRWNTT